MKKIFKSNGNIVIKDVPAPNIEKGFILVKNNYSVISTGTELASLSKMNLLSRANKNNFWKVVGIIKQQGPLKGPQRVISEIKEKSFLAIGYSCAGEIVEVGEGVDEFKKGDKVACGGEYANHAEYVLVPENLAVKVPSNVELEKAALATIASIALQSVRRLEPTIGETIAVVGLGLIGQITAQILKVNGCRVIGIDVNPERVKSEYIDLGLKDFNKSEIFNFTQHNGVDGVIIAASTEANLVNDSFDICRKKGRVVLLGVCGLNIDRNKMYLCNHIYAHPHYTTNNDDNLY